MIQRIIEDRDAGTIPLGWSWRVYGQAWRNPIDRSTILYPVPLNWLFRWARDGWWRLLRGPEKDVTGLAYAAGWKEGFGIALRDGKREGYRWGRKHEKAAWAVRFREVFDERR